MIANLLSLLPLIASVSAAPHTRAFTTKQIKWEGKCLSVESLYEGAYAEEIQDGNNPNGVRLAGTNFCLDAGEGAVENADAKIWTCYRGLFQQTWWYTDDNHLAVTGGSVCLDSCGGAVQTYRCEGDQPNQIFNVVTVDGGNNPGPSASSSSSAPVPSGSGTPSPGSTQLRWGNGCIAVQTKNGRAPAQGDLLAVGKCTKGAADQFNVKKNTPGPIRLASNPNLCVDADVAGGYTNGKVIKLWECLEVPQQQWYYTDDDHLAVLGGNTCIDVKDGRSALQTWQCIGYNTNQMFYSS